MNTAVPIEIAAWLGCLAFAVGLFNQLAKAKSNMLGEKPQSISPQPLEVKEVTGHCPVHQSVASQIEQTRLDLVTDRKTAADYRRNLYEKIEGLRLENKSDNSAVYERIDSMRKELSEKIDGMEARIIATLNNTGAINRQRP